jgi:hypothetical protein
MVQHLIETLAAIPGLKPGQAHDVAQILLRMSRNHLSPALARDLFATMPGAEALVEDAERASRKAHDGIEAMMSEAMRNVLGVADPLATALGELKAAGLNSSQALLAGRSFVKFAHERAGKEIAARMKDEIPGLSRLS